jgi:hypothetical protein
MDRPELRPEVRQRLRQRGAHLLERFVDWLDKEGSERARNHLIDLYQGFEPDVAYQFLASHPWSHVLFDEEFGLRAECLGEAAVASALRQHARGGTAPALLEDCERRARLMYGKRQYETAYNLVAGATIPANWPHLNVLKANARIMSALYGDASPGEDTDWRKLLAEVRVARELVQGLNMTIDKCDALLDRYQELEELAEALTRLDGKIMQAQEGRLIDVLAGLRGQPAVNPKAALRLLLLKIEAGESIPGNASACQAVIALPEQIYRFWAFWRTGVSYYSSPAGEAEAWNDAIRAFPQNHGQLKVVSAGQEFGSLKSFAYFVHAKLLRDWPQHVDSAPMRDFTSIEQKISKYTHLRNPLAHSVCLTTPKDRKMFFLLINDWFDALLAASPEPVTRTELRRIIEPLPLVNKDGAVRTLIQRG